MAKSRSVGELLEELGEWRVRAARGTGKARLSLRDLSAASGVPVSSLAKYLSGATLMPTDALDAVVLALGATPAQAREWAQAWECAAAAQLRPAEPVPAAVPTAVPGAVPVAVSGPANPVPRLLPADVPAFTGRESALEVLDRMAAQGTGGAVVITAAVSGTAGVGKTALAVHWAHRVCELFPDGQLYVNLRGYDPGDAMSAHAALEFLLRVLGQESVPADPDLRAATYRSALAGRRMLLVFDNARSAEHVRPLLPGASGCLTVVTSRDELMGLVARDGARRLNLERLSAGEAAELLFQLLGEQRFEGESVALADLVRLCSGLPLALRVAAERIASRPQSPLSALVAELADGSRRLDLLAADGDPLSDVRAVFSWSSRAMPEPAVRLFRLLSLVPGPDIDAHGAANLAALPLPEARRLLDSLVSAHLVERSSADRYSMHDLLRVYAAEQAEECLAADERRDAFTRLLDWALATADSAANLVNPGRRKLPDAPAEPVTPGPVLAGAEQARAWLEAERPSLMALIRAAADDSRPDHGRPGHAWQLASSMWNFFHETGYTDDWIAANHSGLAAARAIGNVYAQADALHALGTAYFTRNEYEQAISYLEQALVHWREAAHRRGEAATLNSLGSGYHRMQDYTRAQEYFLQALSANEETGDRLAQAMNLGNLALATGSLGRYREAITRFTDVMDRFTAAGDERWHPQSLGNIARLRIRLGEYSEALTDLRTAVELCEKVGVRRSLAFLHNGLALVHLARGEHDQAADHADRSLTICSRTGDPDDKAHALALLGLATAGLGDVDRGCVLLRQALDVSASHDSPRWEGTIRNDLGGVLLARGDPAAALKEYGTALVVARQTADLYEQARAERGTAWAKRALGEPWQAPMNRALDIFTALQTPEAGAIRAEMWVAPNASGVRSVRQRS